MSNNNPIHVFATWKVKEGQVQNVLEILKTVREETRKENGNLFYDIHQSISDTNVIVLFEGYTDDTAVTEHRNSTHYTSLVAGQIIPLLEKEKLF